MRFAFPLVTLTLSCVFQPALAAHADVGSTTTAIVGGRPAEADETYATVNTLWAWEPFTDQSHACSATLVAPRVVLTAGHCVSVKTPDSPLMLVFSPHDMRVGSGYRGPSDFDQGTFFEIERVEIHPGWRFFEGEPPSVVPGEGKPDDIAFLVLREPILDREPATILPLELVSEVLSDGTEVIASGFGKTEDDSFGALYVATSTIERVGTHELKTAAAEGQGGPCAADSGGPLYVEHAGEIYLVGVASRLVSDCGTGAIYGLAPAYIEWLNSEAPMSENNNCSPTNGDGGGQVALKCALSPGRSGNAAVLALLAALMCVLNKRRLRRN